MIQMELSAAAQLRLEEIRRQENLSTSEVFRQALLMFDWFLTYRKAGGELKMIDYSGKIIPIPDLSPRKAT